MRILALILFILISAVAPAQAEALFGKPVYDPASKSYFELIKVTSAQAGGSASPGLPWNKIAALAAGRVYKGTKGRLAIVKTHETHMFIMQTIQPSEETLIGLRYLCKLHQLRWVNGEVLERGSFQPWHPNWDQSGNAGCVKQIGEADWMPIAYKPAAMGFQWFAKGAKKYFGHYLIEYPTGEP